MHLSYFLISLQICSLMKIYVLYMSIYTFFSLSFHSTLLFCRGSEMREIGEKKRDHLPHIMHRHMWAVVERHFHEKKSPQDRWDCLTNTMFRKKDKWGRGIPEGEKKILAKMSLRRVDYLGGLLIHKHWRMIRTLKKHCFKIENLNFRFEGESLEVVIF